MESGDLAPSSDPSAKNVPTDGSTVAVLLLAATALPFGLAAGPHLFDAGELVAAALQLGGSHPPGQPMHAILGKLAAWLPLGSLATRVALLSSAGALAAAALNGGLSRLLMTDCGIGDRRLLQAGSAAAALGTLLAGPVLRQAMRVEVYSLALALCLWAARDLLYWARTGQVRLLLRAVLAGSLAATVHPPHGMAAALFGVAVVVGQPRLLMNASRGLIGAVAFGVLGLSLFIYLPVRAAAGAPMWGRPQSASGLWDYVSARSYRHNISALDGGFIDNALLAGHHWVIAAGLFAMLGTGCLFVFARQAGKLRQAAALGSLLALAMAALQPLQSHNPDHVAYLGPAVCLLVVCGVAGMGVLAARLPWPGLLGMFLVAVHPLTATGSLAHADNDLPYLETLAASLTETPPPRALVIATTDYSASSWMMLRQTDGARPDTALFVAGLASSSWQWAALASHPALDGRPVRGRGDNAHEAYLDGLLHMASPVLPIAVERDAAGWLPMGFAGPYAIIESWRRPDQPGRPPLRLADSIGERLVASIGADRRRGPAGDGNAGAAIVRDYEITRAHRLLSTGHTAEAMDGFARCLPLQNAERQLLRGRTGTMTRALPPMVHDPTAFLVSAEDAVRMAAGALWSIGDGLAARKLLEGQSGRGDPRALLQLGWLQFAEGDLQAATRSRDMFRSRAPSLTAEDRSLSAALARAAAP